MNRTWMRLPLTVAVLVVPALAGWALPVEVLGYERTDLELISQESLDAWTSAWTGPIETATILAWLHDNGYGRLLEDLNSDGAIDELDTILLADRLGQEQIHWPGRPLTAPEGTTDVRLVVALAQYVAARYPGEFELKIYDASFPAEYSAEGRGTFRSDAVSGILMTLKTEPTVGAYKEELASGEAVIVGLETAPRENNSYLSGRSFLFSNTADGYTPIDAAWAAEDLWKPGHQGQVLSTLGKMTDRFYLQYQGTWVPIEFMLALSPIVKPGGATTPQPCRQDALAYDVQYSQTPYGTVKIEECVTRAQVASQVLDTYTYTVTNMSFARDGCGLCFFSVPGDPAIVATTQSISGPALWQKRADLSGAWWWRAAAGTCGILIGQSGVFSFTVAGPTTDAVVTGYVGECEGLVFTTKGEGEGIIFQAPVVYEVVTTGPTAATAGGQSATREVTGACCLPDGSCQHLTRSQCVERGGDWYSDGDCAHCGATFVIPGCIDLAFRVAVNCGKVLRFGGGMLLYYEWVITADVTVFCGGDSSVDDVLVMFVTDYGVDEGTISHIAAGGRATIKLEVTVVDAPFCEIMNGWIVTIDPQNTIGECDEGNNTDTGTFDCPDCQGYYW